MAVQRTETQYRVILNRDHCKACYYCMELCPRDVFQASETINQAGYFPVEVIREASCTGCMLCYFICPDFAIALEG